MGTTDTAETVDETVITDDSDARTTATQRDIWLTGSIGLLVRFIESDLISAARPDTSLKRWVGGAGSHSPAHEFETFRTETVSFQHLQTDDASQ